MNTDRIDMQEIARQACGMPPAPLMEDRDEAKALADELRQRTKERDAWSTHCKRAEAEVADLICERDALQARLDTLRAVDEMNDDMRSIVGELRRIHGLLILDWEGKQALSALLRKIDLESQ